MSEMRPLLVETARRLMADAGEEFSDALWRRLDDAGLPSASVAEAKGGAGADWGDAMAILREAGRQALPALLGETMLARWLLAENGLAAPEGVLTVAPVEDEPLHLARVGREWRIEGTARFVPWARHAAGVAVLAAHERETVAALVSARGLAIAQGKNLADEPRDAVTFAATLPGDAVAASPVAWDALQRRGAVMRAAMMAGALEAVLEMTVRYTTERVQFGRPIAKFQAIQQQVADLAAQVAAASVAADAASFTPDDVFAVAVAKARVGDAAGPVAAIAHQVHGAMGFAREHRLNLYTRRLWSWREEFGDETYWQRLIGRAALQAGGVGLWRMITGGAG